MARAPGEDSRVALIDWLTALGEVNRLRILRALEVEELSVGELARIVQLPQSTVSRHLKALLGAGLVGKRARGTASMYRLRADELAPAAAALWSAAREELGRARPFDAERARLAHVVAARHTDTRDFFGRLGSEWDRLRRELFGQSFTAQALLAMLDPRWVVVDAGCGTGEISELLAPAVKRIIAVDREPAMLDAARKRLARFRNVEFRAGELQKIPVRSGEADAAVVSLVLHHLDEPGLAVRELARCLNAARAGGVLLIIDMVAHDRESYRQTMGHKHLGFSQREVKSWARAAGMTDVRYLPLRPDAAARGPGLFVAALRT